MLKLPPIKEDFSFATGSKYFEAMPNNPFFTAIIISGRKDECFELMSHFFGESRESFAANPLKFRTRLYKILLSPNIFLICGN